MYINIHELTHVKIGIRIKRYRRNALIELALTERVRQTTLSELKVCVETLFDEHFSQGLT